MNFQEKILNEKLTHEKEIESLQKEIVLAKEVNTIAPEQNTELPVIENKLKESNVSSNINDDDEMVSLCIDFMLYNID